MFEQFKNQVLLSERFTTISLDTGFVKKSYAMADCFHRMKLELNCFAAIKLFSTKHEASNSGRKLGKKKRNQTAFSLAVKKLGKMLTKLRKNYAIFLKKISFFTVMGMWCIMHYSALN